MCNCCRLQFNFVMHLKRYLFFFGYLYILETFSMLRRGLVIVFGWKRRKIVDAKDKCDFSTSIFS